MKLPRASPIKLRYNVQGRGGDAAGDADGGGEGEQGEAQRAAGAREETVEEDKKTKNKFISQNQSSSEVPVLYKYIFKFSLSGFKKFNFFITFL